MKAIALACTLLAAAPAFAEQRCASVEVSNVRAGKGFLMVAAYDSAAGFNKTAVSSLRLPAGDATMRFELCGLSGDTVALTLYQDLDGDGKMGKNLFGIPTEPWGASGTPGAMGPTWDSSKVPLDGKPIAVKMGA